MLALPRRLGLEQLHGGIIISVNITMLLAAFAILGLIPVSIASEDISSLVKQVMPGVVLIQTYDSKGNGLGQGSGFVISKDGDVITCYHVMRGYSTATVTTSDEKKFQARNITALNKSDDLARISLSAENHSFSNLSLNTTTPDVGQEIIAIGGPLGLEKTVSQGIVSAIRNNTIQITAPISPGSSGGPVFNMNGEVIGIVSSQMKSGQNLNFAIPANLISIMQPASGEQVKELREPYYSTEVESSDTPLLKKLGYASEEQLLESSPGYTLKLAYDKECWRQFTQMEKYEDAAMCYDCMLKIYPTYGPAWNSKGAALYHQARYEEALFCFNKSLEFDPAREVYLQNKGKTLHMLHRESEAEKFFAKANEIKQYQPIGYTIIVGV